MISIFYVSWLKSNEVKQTSLMLLMLCIYFTSLAGALPEEIHLVKT